MSLSVETYVLAKNYTDSVIDSGAGGVVPNITMTAVQLEAGEQPTVVKGGTNVNPTFELGIPQGEPGFGVPTGGNTGQVLAKASDNDYDMVWINQSGGGGGGDIVLQSIEITTPPNKTIYNAGEVFDNTGMVVTAYYNFGLSQTITGYTISPSGSLTGDVTEITVNYSEGGIVKNTTYPITVNRNIGAITINPNSISLDANTQSMVVEVVYNGDGELTVENTNPSLVSAELSDGSMTIKSLGDTSEVVTITVNASETGYYTAANAQISVNNYISAQIYGVLWDGTSNSKFSRTDDAELFEDPTPAINNGMGSSPFDNIMPWSGMKRVTDPIAGELVEIPKFWYKWTKTGVQMQLQISNGPQDGFYVSPAHANRGDGQGERDFAYIGRYHCNNEYKSTTNSLPVVNITRNKARSGISSIGEEYWQYDYSMLWTINMLYLVEFANWNCQEAIGYGCSPDNKIFNVGLTDSMQYHTGTSAINRTTYGCCQYRYIEGLWDNVYMWCDGIYFSNSTIYCINNPKDFSDTSNGSKLGSMNQTNGYISSWEIPDVTNFEYALYPNSTTGNISDSLYICDSYSYNSLAQVAIVGGHYSQTEVDGLFFGSWSNNSETSLGFVGCRLQKLPNNS